MILSRLDDFSRILPLHPRFKQAFAYLSQHNLAELSPGTYELDGKNLYVSVTEKQGKPESEAALEAHRTYIDIQFLISGRERIGWKALSACSAIKTPYDAQKDILFYSDPTACWLTLNPGEFAVFFPEDAHAPMVSDGIVKKAVVKVLL